jgi:hypothetical protein
VPYILRHIKYAVKIITTGVNTKNTFVHLLGPGGVSPVCLATLLSLRLVLLLEKAEIS